LPANYEASAQRYPTLFLLHGLYGDDQNWSTRTNLVKYARDLNLIIAMPDAGNSWYVNSASNPEDRYEDYIVKDSSPRLTRTTGRFVKDAGGRSQACPWAGSRQ